MINKIECLEILPEDFDPLTYIRMNLDLEKATEKMNSNEKIAFAKNHYLNYGKIERRKYLDLTKYIDMIHYLDSIGEDLTQKNEEKIKNVMGTLKTKKKAYIHIGYGKTGTTAIQDFFYNNYNILKNNKILYPLSTHNNGDLAIFPEDTEETYKRKLKNYASIISDMLNIEHNVVFISSEHLKYISNNLMILIKNIFLNYDVHIIFNIRRQIELLPSVFLQIIRVNGFTFGKNIWEMHTHTAESGFNFNNLIAPWENVFGKSAIKASLYHPEIIGKDAVLHFLNILGINDPEFISKLHFESEYTNTSIHTLLANLLTVINQNKKLDNRPEIIEELLNVSKHIKHIKHSLFTPKQEIEIKKYYAESNAAFADKYLTPREKELLLS